MSERFNALSQQLFQKNIVDCPVAELENLAHEYPYFAPVQYLLVCRLKNEAYQQYEAQLQKSILYYHDPLSFDQFINSNDYNVDFTELPVEESLLHQKEELAIEEPAETFEAETSEEVEKIEIETQIFTEPIGKTVEQKTIADEKVDALPQQEEPAAETEMKETPQEQIQLKPLLNIDTKVSDSALTFEPYHTVDYFASQGIKLSQEEAVGDKFGKQLKSFTEWLKTMKKLPAAEQVKPLDVGAEKKVENLAAHSIETEEVYTETMAEVWAQQGNKEKAREVYNKLSLLNPSKRAYFAAKIDSLT